tara:strand:+ start:62 stop:310 length:249 start_codon:yes stop_codon:yes gene_type:complete
LICDISLETTYFEVPWGDGMQKQRNGKVLPATADVAVRVGVDTWDLDWASRYFWISAQLDKPGQTAAYEQRFGRTNISTEHQ